MPYYLTIEEQNKLATHDLSDRPALAVQRDIFVFQCLVGCSVSDLMEFTPANIINGVLEYMPSKTKNERPEIVRVPLNSKAAALVEKYKKADTGGKLFSFISSQKYNAAIKKIFLAYELTRNVTILDPKTVEEERRPQMKWQAATWRDAPSSATSIRKSRIRILWALSQATRKVAVPSTATDTSTTPEKSSSTSSTDHDDMRRFNPRMLLKKIKFRLHIQKFGKFIIYLPNKIKNLFAMIDVRTAAKYLIQRYKQESGAVMDEIKLLKLLYFTQRESFCLLGKPMFSDKFEAWKYGPVMHSLRKAYWDHQAQSVVSIDPEYIPVLEDTLRRYATMDSWTLSNISHGETCWQKAKEKEVGSSPVEIETSDIEYDTKVIKFRRFMCAK